MPRTVVAKDPYLNTLLKYIPSEIVAAYLAIQAILAGWVGVQSNIITIVISIVLLALIPFHLIFLNSVKRVWQIIVTMIGFVVWLYILGGPFIVWGIHEPRIASVVLILWTLIIPLAKPRSTTPP